MRKQDNRYLAALDAIHQLYADKRPVKDILADFHRLKEEVEQDIAVLEEQMEHEDKAAWHNG